MRTTFAIASIAAALTTVAEAHTIFQELSVNGISQGRLNGIRVPTYDGPITDVTSNDVICNGGINPYLTPISTTVIPVPAGAQVTAQFHHTLTSNSGDQSDPIDPSHNGPIIAYLAQVPSAAQSTVTGLKWFKIYEDGLDASGWAVERLIVNNGKVSFTIPNCIPAGEYLLRVELIALHAASSYPGAQLYMECAQLKITGGGDTSPAPTVSFPGAYSGSDPGIKFNLYAGAKSYTIPGPSVFSCSGSSNPTTSTTVKPTTTTTSQIISTTTTQAPATTTTPASGGTVARYGQCGGIGYTGPTACVAPYTCVKSGDYYSQCL